MLLNKVVYVCVRTCTCVYLISFICIYHYKTFTLMSTLLWTSRIHLMGTHAEVYIYLTSFICSYHYKIFTLMSTLLWTSRTHLMGTLTGVEISARSHINLRSSSPVMPRFLSSLIVIFPTR